MKEMEHDVHNQKPSSRKNGGQNMDLPPDEPQKNTIILHFIFIGLIVIIAGVAIFRLVRWNQGRDSEYDPNEITTAFDTEPEDYILPLDSETASLQKDDGVTTILCLGNAPFADMRGEKGIEGYLADYTGGKVYNAAFDNTFLSVKNATYDESYPADAFSLYWVSMCLSLKDFTLLEDNARVWDGDEKVSDTINILKNLDMSTVDVISIMYDGSDYLDQRLLAGPYDETLAASCCGCLLQSVRLLKDSFPQARIVISSPYFILAEDENGEAKPASTVDYSQGFLPDYMVAYKNIAVNAGASFLDHYYGSITEDNYKKYLEDDANRLNDDGRRLIAQRIASAIGSSK